MSVALIVGSFDPIIMGQVDLVTRAATLFRRVVVGVERMPTHVPLFPLEERIARVQSALKGQPTVEIQEWDGDFPALVAERGAAALVVALRSALDAEHLSASWVTSCDLEGIELVALLSAPQHAFVTTALVRDVLRLDGDASSFIPPSGDAL